MKKLYLNLFLAAALFALGACGGEAAKPSEAAVTPEEKSEVDKLDNQSKELDKVGETIDSLSNSVDKALEDLK